MPKNPKKARFASLYYQRFEKKSKESCQNVQSEITIGNEKSNQETSVQSAIVDDNCNQDTSFQSNVVDVTNDNQSYLQEASAIKTCRRIESIEQSVKQKIESNENSEDKNYIIVDVDSLNSLLTKAQCSNCGCATLTITVNYRILCKTYIYYVLLYKI